MVVSVDLEKTDSITKVGHVEVQPGQPHHVSPREIQGRFDLLRGLSEEDMEKLNKSVLKKIDWRMMPTITMMFLMK